MNGPRLFLSLCAFATLALGLRATSRPGFETVRVEGVATGPVPYRTEKRDGGLVIHYQRKAASADWASLDWELGQVDLSRAPRLSFEVRTDRTLLLAMRLYDKSGRNLWFERSLQADHGWQRLTVDVSSIEEQPFTKLQFFLNPAVGRDEAGTVELRDFRFGGEVELVPDIARLDQAISDARRLLAQAEFTTDEALACLRLVLTNVETRRESVRHSVETCELLTRDLLDACMEAETAGVAPGHGLSDPRPTRAAVALRRRLLGLQGRHCLFGMQDMTTYGIEADGSTWFNKGRGERSDPLTVAGAHAVVLGLDAFNLAENELPELAQLARDHAAQGGLVTVVWHMNNLNGGPCRDFTPVIPDMLPGGARNAQYLRKLERFADWAKALRLPSGEAVPLLFRPFHEHTGSWFYWGRGRCTADEYRALWRYTVKTLRERFKLHQLLIVISPDGNQYETEEEYLFQYPGDDVVDVLGLDYYFGKGDQAEIDKLAERLRHIVRWAQRKGKLAALAETGDRMGWDDTEMLEIEQWYTRCLLGSLTRDAETRQVVYALVWRNGHPRHCFVPYPGHPAVEDFRRFRQDPFVRFLSDPY